MTQKMTNKQVTGELGKSKIQIFLRGKKDAQVLFFALGRSIKKWKFTLGNKKIDPFIFSTQRYTQGLSTKKVNVFTIDFILTDIWSW